MEAAHICTVFLRVRVSVFKKVLTVGGAGGNPQAHVNPIRDVRALVLRGRNYLYSATCDNSVRKKDWLALLQAWNAATS